MGVSAGPPQPGPRPPQAPSFSVVGVAEGPVGPEEGTDEGPVGSEEGTGVDSVDGKIVGSVVG